MKKWDILIGVPSYDRKLYIETSKSITGTIVELVTVNAKAALFAVSGCALITHARNAIVAEFLARKEKTHLLFVDADMEWQPHTVLRMLKANVPFAAAPYAKKRYSNSATLRAQPKNFDMLQAASLEWNLEFHDRDVLSGKREIPGVRGGFARVVRVGAGLTLLRRDMLETMVSKYADTEYKWDGRSDNISPRARYFGLFDLMKDPNGVILGEDYAFCDRWVNGCDGEIWCDIDARLGHHGHHRYSGALAESLRLRGRFTDGVGTD
ncbi:hypothetical protein ACWIGM_00720 [Bosea sp. NPDC055332]